MGSGHVAGSQLFLFFQIYVQFWAGSGFDFLSISKLHADAASLSLMRRKQTNIKSNTVDLVSVASVSVRNVRAPQGRSFVSNRRAARAARFALAA